MGEQAEGGTATAEKAPRAETDFRVFVRPKGEATWTTLDETVSGRTQDEAKKKAARVLNDIEEYALLIQGDGIELAVTAARSFKPVLVRVEPQPAKVVLR